jgi:flavin-dependent dehydrogenase
MDGNLSNIDVIIIGAGPAGSASAIWCAMNKLSVLIVEWKKFPRHKPGETLHPGISTLFEHLQVKSDVYSKISFRHKGYIVVDEIRKEFNHFNPVNGADFLGFQILREDLDKILLQKAKELGVRILQPCRALSLIKNEERIIGLHTSEGDFFSQYVIDAGGSSHWLARRMNLKIQKYSIPLIVKYGYSKGKLGSNKYSDPVFTFHQDGWLWGARIGEDLYHWARLTTLKKNNSNLMEPEDYSVLKKIGTSKAADVTWRRIPECAGKGYFLVGDASVVFDPSASKGVLRGIYSGIMAGHSILRLINEQLDEISIAKSFTDWMDAWFHHDLKIMQTFYNNENIYIQPK